MLKLENSIRGLSFSRVAFDLTIQDKKRAAEATLSYYSTPTITLVDLITATTSLPTAKPKSLTD